MIKNLYKQAQGIFKPFEGFQKEIGKEVPYYLVGIAMEGGKGLGWKGVLFVWPFVAAFMISAFLFVKIIVGFLLSINI